LDRAPVLSRRELLRAGSVLGVALVAGCKPGGQGAVLDAGPGPASAATGLRTFSAQEASGLEALCDLVLVRDPGWPKAKKFDAMGFLDRELSARADLDLFRRGLRWLDRASRDRFGRPFAELERARQIELLELAAGSVAPGPADGLDPQGLGRRFFERFRFHAFRGFYASEEGWALVGYAGPPQRPGHCGP
jgi:hypothetical protein